jgi:ornithine--oxo-acid transaminase
MRNDKTTRPCGAIVARRDIYQKTFSRMDRCLVTRLPFGRNNLAMACGLAALEVVDQENLVDRAAEMGVQLIKRIDALRAKHGFIKEVRGKGLIIAIEFHEPSELKLKMAWRLLHKVDKVRGAAMDVLKILPPLMIGEKEIALFVTALDNLLTDYRKFPGPMWELGNNFARAAISSPVFFRKSSGDYSSNNSTSYANSANNFACRLSDF